MGQQATCPTLFDHLVGTAQLHENPGTFDPVTDFLRVFAHRGRHYNDPSIAQRALSRKDLVEGAFEGAGGKKLNHGRGTSSSHLRMLGVTIRKMLLLTGVTIVGSRLQN